MSEIPDEIADLKKANQLLHGLLSNREAEIERLRKTIEAIKQATIDGRVCDDVAWFDMITTLHDFCDQTLSPAERTGTEKTGEGQS